MDKIWYRNPSKSEVIGRCHLVKNCFVSKKKGPMVKLNMKCDTTTVNPVYNDHPWEQQNMVVGYKWSLLTD